MAGSYDRQLVLVVEGTAALGAYWPSLRVNCVYKILRAFCGDEKGEDKGDQKHSGAKVEMGLVVFYTRGPHSMCSVQRSGWTTDLNVIVHWLSGINFSGGGIGDSDVSAGLAEALMMCCSSQAATQTTETIQKHCVLFAASNPYLLPTPVLLPPGVSSAMQNANAESGIVQHRLADANTVAKQYVQCRVSLSVIGPKQLPSLISIFDAGNRNPSETEVNKTKCSQGSVLLVLLSEKFKESCSALGWSWTNPKSQSAPASTPNPKSQSAPASTHFVSVQPPAATAAPSSGPPQTGDEMMVEHQPTSNKVLLGDEKMVEHQPTSNTVLPVGTINMEVPSTSASGLSTMPSASDLHGSSCGPLRSQEVPCSVSTSALGLQSMTSVSQADSGPSSAHSNRGKKRNVTNREKKQNVASRAKKRNVEAADVQAFQPFVNNTSEQFSPLTGPPTFVNRLNNLLQSRKVMSSVALPVASTPGLQKTDNTPPGMHFPTTKRSRMGSAAKSTDQTVSATGQSGWASPATSVGLVGIGQGAPNVAQANQVMSLNALPEASTLEPQKTGITPSGMYVSRSNRMGSAARPTTQTAWATEQSGLVSPATSIGLLGVGQVGTNIAQETFGAARLESYANIGQSIPGMGREGVATGPQTGHCGVGRNQNVLAGKGPVEASSAARRMGTKRSLPHPNHPSSPGLGAGNSAAGNLQLPSNATVTQQPEAPVEKIKMQKVWEGRLICFQNGKENYICRLQAFEKGASSNRIAADWPNLLNIQSVIPREHVDCKQFEGRAKPLTFRALDHHKLLDLIAAKKLFAVIHLPTQILFLSETDKPYQMLGILIPKDPTSVCEPQLPNQPQQQRQQQQQQQEWQQQEPQGLPSKVGQPFHQSQFPYQNRPRPLLRGQQQQEQQQQELQPQGMPWAIGKPLPQTELPDQSTPHFMSDAQFQGQEFPRSQIGDPNRPQTLLRTPQSMSDAQFQEQSQFRNQNRQQPLLRGQQQQEQQQQEEQPKGLTWAIKQPLPQIQLPDQRTPHFMPDAQFQGQAFLASQIRIQNRPLPLLHGQQRREQQQGMPSAIGQPLPQTQLPDQITPQFISDAQFQGQAFHQSRFQNQNIPHPLLHGQQQLEQQQQPDQITPQFISDAQFQGQAFHQSHFQNHNIPHPLIHGQQQLEQQQQPDQITPQFILDAQFQGQAFHQSHFQNQNRPHPLLHGQQQLEQQQPQGMPSTIGQSFPQTQLTYQSTPHFTSHAQFQGQGPTSMPGSGYQT